ncbi:peroxisomal sarcosine oxidase [Exaiptasia diaphana]|uniref:FAD dependent oxidoreductase domain-containing protein n=1 Tax=Exaiptasia diaphana TaxID=2652724 RepID=A0A913YXZ4_EXADI|nr:peroxisomal sarcosine oxidase [Exaiptasia diaphana]
MADIYDVCVVGAGIEGSSTGRYAASRGKKTLLLEQFHLPHSRGSSHGTTRLVRHGYPSDVFANLMPEAFEIWSDVEKIAGKELIKRVGLFSTEVAPLNQLKSLATNVQNLGVPCEILSSADIKRKFPTFKLQGYEGTFEPQGGFILANQALSAMQRQFVQFGGKLSDGEKVTKIEPGSVVLIHTTKNVYRAKSVIITAGKLWRALLTYWKPTNPEKFSIESGFPGFIIYGVEDHDHVYGFPVFEYPGLLKVCHHGGIEISSPEAREEARKNEKFVERVSKFVTDHFDGIEPVPKIIEPCIYTITPDDSFVLDHHPSHKNIVIGAGFSGHGFKMAPLVGKILSQLALGETPSYDMRPFRISRFSNLKSNL